MFVINIKYLSKKLPMWQVIKSPNTTVGLTTLGTELSSYTLGKPWAVHSSSNNLKCVFCKWELQMRAITDRLRDLHQNRYRYGTGNILCWLPSSFWVRNRYCHILFHFLFLPINIFHLHEFPETGTGLDPEDSWTWLSIVVDYRESSVNWVCLVMVSVFYSREDKALFFNTPKWG